MNILCPCNLLKEDAFSLCTFWISIAECSQDVWSNGKNRGISPCSFFGSKWAFVHSLNPVYLTLCLALRIHLFHCWTAEGWLPWHQSVININFSRVTWARLFQLIFRIIFYIVWLRFFFFATAESASNLGAMWTFLLYNFVFLGGLCPVSPLFGSLALPFCFNIHIWVAVKVSCFISLGSLQ